MKSFGPRHDPLRHHPPGPRSAGLGGWSSKLRPTPRSPVPGELLVHGTIPGVSRTHERITGPWPAKEDILTRRCACQWRIDILTDSAGDRWPVEGSHSCGTHSVAVTRSNQLTWTRLEAQNSKWFHWKYRLPISAGYPRERYSLENQAAFGV